MNQKNGIVATSTEAQVNPTSERKRAANRQNASRSTGPKSEAGKGRSRWNALKHGLLVKEVTADYSPYVYDDPKPFERLKEALFDHFSPVGPVEGILFELIAQCYWRQHRFQRAENALIRLDLVQQAYQNAKRDQLNRQRDGDGRDTRAIIEKARQNINRVGYVEGDLQELMVQELCSEYWGEAFIAANQKARESSQRSSGRKMQKKRARTELLAWLKEVEAQLRSQDDRKKEIERRDTDAQYAQHLVCLHPSMVNFLRSKPRTNASCTALLPN
jgi:hypothetical protein